jgi:hypothetical protein
MSESIGDVLHTLVYRGDLRQNTVVHDAPGRRDSQQLTTLGNCERGAPITNATLTMPENVSFLVSAKETYGSMKR